MKRSLILVTLIVLGWCSPALAAQNLGRPVTQADWLERLPLFLICVLFVIVVDTVFFIAARRRALRRSS